MRAAVLMSYLHELHRVSAHYWPGITLGTPVRKARDFSDVKGPPHIHYWGNAGARNRCVCAAFVPCDKTGRLTLEQVTCTSPTGWLTSRPSSKSYWSVHRRVNRRADSSRCRAKLNRSSARATSVIAVPMTTCARWQTMSTSSVETTMK